MYDVRGNGYHVPDGPPVVLLDDLGPQDVAVVPPGHSDDEDVLLAALVTGLLRALQGHQRAGPDPPNSGQ